MLNFNSLKSPSWKGNFKQWFEEIFLKNPEKYSRSSHKYLYDALYYFGETKGIPKKLKDEIYGVDESLNEFLKILKAASENHDVRRRILLLVGPVGTAKSTLVYIIKRILEEYSYTEDGEIFAISDCPMQEDPLHLIPQHLRKHIYDEYGVEIEGELCPVCQYNLENKYNGNIENVEIERFVFSEAKRRGIATFVPGDYNSQDISVLVGTENFLQYQKYGDFSHPLSWNFNGSLFNANRGLHEFVEIHKAKPDLLFPLLVLAQERQIKVDRFGLISADEVLIAHTNYTEYQKFISKKENEAFKDRTREIEWKYNLSLDNEEKIYQKMLKQKKSKTHIAPFTLRFVAAISILSRLEEERTKEDSKGKGYTMLDLLKLYNHEFDDRLREEDLESAMHKNDGKKGISPRIAVDSISFAMSKNSSVMPYDAINELYELSNKQSSDINPDKLEKLIEIYKPEYHKWIKSVVFEAFIGSSFAKECKVYFDKYIEHAFSSVENGKVKDPFTGKYVDFDEKYLRSIEDVIGITKEQARDFRSKLLIKISALMREKKEFGYDVNPKLKEAIEKKVMEDKANFIRGTITSYVHNDEQLQALNEARKFLVDKYGFNDESASDAIKLVASLLDNTA
jgi:serine protein kinase